MKNLKKVLSLALAFAMVLGLCVTGMAAQDVTTLADWDTVTDKDAALLLNAFEIMEGDEDGFRPLDDVKRSEAAALISRALWGGVDNAALYAAGNVGAYTDVIPGYWYMGYINYMTVLKIMTGDGDGEFRPDDTVTGYELLKMALVALGYDAEVEGLVGAGWDMRTMALATAKGETSLITGTDVKDWSAPLNRMNAATILKNMIYRRMVTYNATTGKAETSNLLGVPNPIFGVDVLGMDVVDAVLVGNTYGNVYSTYGIPASDTPALDAEKAENAYVYTTAQDVVAVELDSDIHDLDTPVKLYYTTDINNNYVLVAASLTGWETVTPAFDFAKWQYTNIENPYNGNGAPSTDAWVESTAKDFDGDGLFDNVQNITFGTATEVKDVVETETFGTVYQIGGTKWNAKTMDKGTTLNAGFMTADDIGAEKGDWIVYSVETNVYGKAYNYGYVLGATEGKITRVVFNKIDTDNDNTPDTDVSGTIYINGVKTTNWDYTADFGEEGTFYTYANGSVAKFDPTVEETPDDVYALVYDTGIIVVPATGGINGSAGSVIVEVAAILEDGTSGVYEVAKITVGGKTYDISKQNGDKTFEATDASTIDWDTGSKLEESIGETTEKLVAYTLNDDGSMNISVLGTQPSPATTTIASNSTLIASGVYATADTVSFLQTAVDNASTTNVNEEKWAVVTGTGVLSQVATGVSVNMLTDTYLGSADKATYVVAANAAITVAPTTVPFYYVIANSGQVGSDNGAAIYEVVVYNAETGEVETIETTVAAGDTDGFVAGEYYTTYANGEMSVEISATNHGFITAIEGELIEITNVDSNYNVVGTPALITVNAQTGYHLIAGEDSVAITAADIAVQELVADRTSGTATDSYQVVTIGNHVVVFSGVQYK